MSNLKKVLALVVVFALAISMVVTVNAASIFPDVDTSDDYASAISLLKSLQVVGGDENGNFNADKTITRAEFSKILFVLMNGDPDASLFEGPSAFSDVSEGAWYNGYINWASNLGIVNGKGDNKFAPQDAVTTQEATKMIIVALTGKSTLAWPYGFVAEANKSNIDLFDGATIANAAKPATRGLIAQLAKNAIFATDVATFYVYDGDGNITSKPAAAEAVFDMNSVDTTILETSNENYQIAGTTSTTGIAAVDKMAVYNENKAVTLVDYSSDLAGDYAGYAGSLYYLDNTKSGTKGILDAKDTVVNFVPDNCTIATVKPMNILSSSYVYQLGGIQFDSRTDYNQINTTTGKLVIMAKDGSVTTTALSAAAIQPYFVKDGSVSTSSTVEYGPYQDYDVKVIYDNDTNQINMVYITYLNPFVKLTTYNQDAGVIAVNDSTAFLQTNPNSTSATQATPTLSLTNLNGTAPNKTTVVIDGTIGDPAEDTVYVSIKPSRDYNGVTYTVAPLLSNLNTTFDSLTSDGSVVSGDVTYVPNATVAAAVTAGTIPDSATVLSSANLGEKVNLYLDTTGKQYIYAELVEDTTTDNYVFVKDITTTVSMGEATFAIKVVDKAGKTTTYTLDSDCVSSYLDAANTAAQSYGWTLTTGQDGNVKSEAAIYHKVVNITINSDNEITAIDPLMTVQGAAVSALEYDTDFSTFLVNNSVTAMVNDSTVVFYWEGDDGTLADADGNLYIYTGADLPGFENGTGFYTTENTLKVKALQLIDAGTALSGNLKYGVVTDYTISAGSTSGKVKYTVTATVDGQLTASLTTAEEAVGGPMGTILASANKTAKFVGFTFSADGDTVVSMTTPTIVSGSAMTDGEGLHIGVVTLASNGLYAINGVEFTSNGYATITGAPKYFSVDDDTNIYLIPNTATNFYSYKSAITPRLNKTSALTLSLGVQGNLVAATSQVRYVVVFSSDEDNVIGDAFIYQSSQIAPTLSAVAGLTATPGDTQVALTWTAQANATGYTVAYKATADSTWTTATVATNSKTITGLTNATSYDFKVLASNAEATGAYSAVVASTPVAPVTP